MLTKCECDECNCDNASVDDVCGQCWNGNHATSKWKDGSKVRLHDAPIDIETDKDFMAAWSQTQTTKNDIPMRNLFQRYINEIRKLREQIKQLEAMKGIHWQ